MRQTSFRYSVVTGLVAGIVLLVFACAFLFYGPQDVRDSHAGVITLVVVYVAAGLIGGAIFWLMQPLMARGHPGRGLVGFLSTAPLGVAVGLSIPATMGAPEPRIIAGLVWAGLMGGGYFMVDR